ncbi:hypothetical protein AAG570_011683 [Ranatra chinensis]|uniref:Uncharacterized protein n=1 Tax=Ranatra chinensis TaxID=642074 RepID=A0ABD0YGT6_9HEMI
MTAFISEFGLCYSYNSVIAFYHEPSYWESNNWTLKTDQPYFKGSPLDGDIFAQIMNMNSGFEMYVHSPEEIPDTALKRLESHNNSYKTVDVQALSIYSTEAAQRLTVSQRKCRKLAESDLTISPAYTYNQCRIQCRLALANSICQCIPHFYRNTNPRFKGRQVSTLHIAYLFLTLPLGP